MEHIVKVLVGGRVSNGWCQTCGWTGPRRWHRSDAQADALGHAIEMAEK